MENMNDKYSIKNLLFTKAIPNYVIPVQAQGCKVYACTDCGDKFLMESSYYIHTYRKSLKISYMCRLCNKTLVFYNRCNLLSHIRMHTFKTATINVFDLKVEPLPFNFFKMDLLNNANNSVNSNNSSQVTNEKNPAGSVCFECKGRLGVGAIATSEERVSHFMQHTNAVYSCPVCLFTVPTVCGLKTHMRLHLKNGVTYYCPECGMKLMNKNICYPYNHDCESFNMMRATARLKCSMDNCHLFHPNSYKEHIKENHLKIVFKCPYCVVACFNEVTMERHLETAHEANGRTLTALTFYQCQFCPGRLVLQNHLDSHLRSHINSNVFSDVFPCWICGQRYKDVAFLIQHHLKKHIQSHDVTFEPIKSLVKPPKMTTSDKEQEKQKKFFRVVKRCDQCKRNFTYRCKYDEIPILPNECPYKCTASENKTSEQIKCPLCTARMSQNWDVIKKHYSSKHPEHRCLDMSLTLTKMDIQKYLPKNKNTGFGAIKPDRTKKKKKNQKRTTNVLEVSAENNMESMPSTSCLNVAEYECNRCGHKTDDKIALEMHIKSHRDPCMAYQCMECGQNFVVKPSFSTHLLLEHGISDADEYINKKQCYNERALDTYNCVEEINEPLSENQCKICREQFENVEMLEKHFRMHGMAFLKKNTPNKCIS